MNTIKTKNLPSSGDDEEKEVDRISMLPDNLIHKILSFVYAKYAVQTCVLSKRWIDIWKSLPFLNFKRNEERNCNVTFMNFVDMMLLYRDDNTCIQKLTVIWDNNGSSRTVMRRANRWMLEAVKRNVKEITVDIVQKDHIMYEIPHQLISCRSLTDLKLQTYGGGRKAAIKLSKLMCLPQLKVLCLHGFSISNVELTEKLFSSCPVLETICISDFDIQTQQISDADIQSQRNFVVDSRSLKYLNLDTSDYRHHTVTSLTTLSAPNLEEFVCSGLMRQEYSFGKFSSLVNAVVLMKLKKESKDENLDTYSKLPAEDKQLYAKTMMKFLVAVHKVVLSQAPSLLDRQLPHLSNLQYLELEMWFTRDSLRSIAYLLKISPMIYSVVLTSKESNPEDIENDWEEGLSSPGMLSRLKIVHIKEVVGCDSELKLLSFLLKNAMVLEYIALFFRSSVGLAPDDRVRQVEQIMDKLRVVPAVSADIARIN